MAQRYPDISDKLKLFIEAQKIFFVGTATADSRVNISPKGMDSLRVINKNRVLWLNVTGSGNESAAHIEENNRITLMFATFDGAPMILRLYGQAKVIHINDSDWHTLYQHFRPLPGARQIFDVAIELVQTSCGMGVPLFDYAGNRELLNDWAVKKGETGIQDYWQEKNRISLDRKPIKMPTK